MIVPCSQCHTRFKVPDGKVSARGRRVRCTRCGHTFRVHPESAAREADPFAQFGPAGSSELEDTPTRGTPAAELLAAAQRTHVGDDFDVDDSGEPLTPAWNFKREAPGLAPIPVRPLPPEPPQTPEEPAPARAADAAEEPPASPSQGRGPVAFDPFHTVPGASPPGDPEGPPPGGQRPDLFSGPLENVPPGPGPTIAELLGETPASPGEAKDVAKASSSSSGKGAGPPAQLGALAGFTPAWGIAGPVRALSADGRLSRAEPGEHLAADEPPTAPPSFGGAGTELDDLPSPGELGPASGESLELDPHPEERAWRGAPPVGHQGGPFELPAELLPPELEPAGGPPPSVKAPALEPSRPATPPIPGGGPAPSAANRSTDVAWDDPFANPPAASPSPGAGIPRAPFAAASSVPLDEPTAAGVDRGMFELAPPRAAAPAPAAPQPLLPDIPDASEPAPLDPIAVPVASLAPVARILRPARRTRMGLDERAEPGAARRLTGVALNVGIAGLLLLVVAGLGSGYVSQGRLDWSVLSPHRWLTVLGPRHGVAPTDLTNGLYETRSGRPVLYVRGMVHNRGEPTSRVRVRAELWDGGRRVKTAETLAGASATPEELWQAGTTPELEALRQKLLASAASVADGRSAEFLVVFDEPPADMAGLRLRVLASIEPEARARTGPQP